MDEVLPARGPRRRVDAEKIREHSMTVLRQNRFGVKLHALDVELAMAHAHDFAVLGPRGKFQTGRNARPLDGERMVARRLEWIRQPLKHALRGVLNQRGLAVHNLPRAHDLAAECLADRLMAETDA